MTFAPIALFVYNRPDHTLRIIEALAQNELANKSKLFIFSDGAKNTDAINSVTVVRKILNTATRGFKKVVIIEIEENFDF